MSTMLNTNQAIRAKLLNPPIKLTREVVEQKDATIRELRGTVASQTADLMTRQSLIDRLVEELREARREKDEATKRLRDIAEAENALGTEGLKHWKMIARDVLREWPGVSWAQVKGGRRCAWIVGARRACVREIHKQRPDLGYSDLGRIVHKDHSTIMTILGKRK